jgi:hypothetical protein
MYRRPLLAVPTQSVIPELATVATQRFLGQILCVNHGHSQPKGRPMLKNSLSISLMAALAAFTCAGLAQAQSSAPNLSGSYRCQPQPDPCKWQGQTATISQSGTKLELKINSDELAEGKLTSNITVSAGPPYNAEGLVRPDHSIEWSNGTKWIKQ